jgi:toxin FitB
MSDGVLLDTNIVSELSRKAPDPRVLAFLAGQPRLHVSVILFHELQFGLEQADDDRKVALTVFLQDIGARFAARALPVDLNVAETAGRLRAFERKQGRILSVPDAFMAATAMIHDLPLATRNVRDFERLSIRLINPFEA